MNKDWAARLRKGLRGLVRRPTLSQRRRGDLARNAGDWIQAAVAYRAHLSASPDDGPLWVQLGHVLKEAGDYAGADDAYRTAEDKLGADADLLLSRGRLARLVGDDVAATRLLAASFALDAEAGAIAELFDERGVPHLKSALREAADLFGWRPVGRVEHATLGAAVGWAADPDDPNTPALVEFFQGDRRVGEALADSPRPDLVSAGLVTQGGGFRFELSDIAPDPVTGWMLSARLGRTGEPLAGSPFSAEPPAPVR